MVFKGAATLIVRLTRAVISKPLKPILTSHNYQLPKLNKTQPVYSKYPTRFYLFPSIYRSFINTLNGEKLANAVPSRIALNEIKRRLFFAAPSSSRLLLGLLGYSLVQQSIPIDRLRLDKTFTQIGNLLSRTTTTDQFNENNEDYSRTTLNDYEFGRLLGCGCNAAVYEARLRSPDESDFEILSSQDIQENVASDILPAGQFNLAIKMLFNYGIQSNAEAIRKGMSKELIPLNHNISHPNIIHMYSSFVDSFPLLNDAYEYYPMAIPTRLSMDSFGRNQTLFIVMKRYDLTLNQYLQAKQPTEHERFLLFLQLIEALLYLNKHSIVHRDLKSDNLLINNLTGELVLTDFGCALQYQGLKVPYPTDEICKGGNLALMAPEISTCKPGPNSFLDYRKSDLWASGSLFYDFFSQTNPFFHGLIDQETYNERNLPKIADCTSPTFQRIIQSILRKNPKKRPSVSVISNAIHICLWFNTIKSENEFLQAYMWTALETLYNKNILTRVEFNLKKLFFERQNSHTLNQAQKFLNEL